MCSKIRRYILHATIRYDLSISTKDLVQVASGRRSGQPRAVLASSAVSSMFGLRRHRWHSGMRPHRATTSGDARAFYAYMYATQTAPSVRRSLGADGHHIMLSPPRNRRQKTSQLRANWKQPHGMRRLLQRTLASRKQKQLAGARWLQKW